MLPQAILKYLQVYHAILMATTDFASMAHAITRLFGPRLSQCRLHGDELVFPDVDLVIIPKPGLLVGFPSNHKFVYAVPKVLSGKRYSLPVWFSVDSTKAMQM
jgi:hypothetical protein